MARVGEWYSRVYLICMSKLNNLNSSHTVKKKHHISQERQLKCYNNNLRAPPWGFNLSLYVCTNTIFQVSEEFTSSFFYSVWLAKRPLFVNWFGFLISLPRPKAPPPATESLSKEPWGVSIQCRLLLTAVRIRPIPLGSNLAELSATKALICWKHATF